MLPFPKNPTLFFLYYVKRYKKSCIGILLCTLLATLFERFIPLYFSKLIDIITENLTTKDRVWKPALFWLSAIIISEILFIIFRRISFLFLLIITSISKKITSETTNYILHHSPRFLSNHPSGKLANRVEQLVQSTETLFWMFAFEFYIPLITVLITLGILLWINWLFAIAFIFWLLVLFYTFFKTSLLLKNFSADYSEKNATISGRIVDILNNSLLVKSFARFNFEQSLLRPLLQERQRSDILLTNKIQTTRSLQFLIVALFKFSMIILSIYLWGRNLISTGSIVLVLLLVNNIMMTFQHFVFSLLEWHKTNGKLENALQVISQPHEIQDTTSQKLDIKKASISFKNIYFEYKKDKPIFKNFSLNIKAGERIGLVGVSGSGKSSLISLLQRFYEVQSGSILINNQDISSITLNSLRESISIIPQDTALFHRSLFDNIAYGNPKSSEKQVFSASRKAYAHKFIQETENGYNSLVGDRGVKLSGGQRQRIAIARAILKKAPILILDEATSALDSESEKYIQKSMKKLMKGKTVIAIAHRLSTLKEMDRILVLQKGRIIEQGSPSELLKKNGRYAKLWALQTTPNLVTFSK